MARRSLQDDCRRPSAGPEFLRPALSIDHCRQSGRRRVPEGPVAKLSLERCFHRTRGTAGLPIQGIRSVRGTPGLSAATRALDLDGLGELQRRNDLSAADGLVQACRVVELHFDDDNLAAGFWQHGALTAAPPIWARFRRLAVSSRRRHKTEVRSKSDQSAGPAAAHPRRGGICALATKAA